MQKYLGYAKKILRPAGPQSHHKQSSTPPSDVTCSQQNKMPVSASLTGIRAMAGGGKPGWLVQAQLGQFGVNHGFGQRDIAIFFDNFLARIRQDQLDELSLYRRQRLVRVLVDIHQQVA